MNVARVTWIFWVLTATAMAGRAEAADPTTEAKQVFASFVERVNSFDPAVADLYAEDARIENTRKYPDGTKKTAIVPAPQYKSMLRSAMPTAKHRRDTSDFLAVEYKATGDKIRITATRLSSATGEATPLSLVVGAGSDGKWMILEEQSESRPQRVE